MVCCLIMWLNLNNYNALKLLTIRERVPKVAALSSSWTYSSYVVFRFCRGSVLLLAIFCVSFV